MQLGIDIGGTFTDTAFVDDDGMLRALKVPSTPGQPEAAVRAAFARLSVTVGDLERFVHGTTIVTNLLVERTGGKVVLITTAGFEDLLEIQGGDKPNTYDTTWRKPTPFVPRPLRLGVDERIDSEGNALIALTASEVERVIEELEPLKPEAIAISFLNAHLNAAHEQLVADALKAAFPAVHCCTSSGVDPAVREYERTSTTVLNAYAMTRITDYIRRQEYEWGEVQYASSSGGAVSAATAARLPLSLAFSGPAGGVGGARALSRAADYGDVITFDMGGTSTDVAIIRDGDALIRQHTEVDWGIPYRFPSLDIKSVGAGGGSVVWLDRGGALRVGPRSAGSEPGPASYGRGGQEPAVTDVNLLLGLLPSRSLGYGSVTLGPELARDALAPIAASLGVTIAETAHGAWRIVNAAMAQAIRQVTVYKGIDPRDFSLFCFGSAAGQHAAAVGRELRLPRVIVPAAAPVFSAMGLLSTRLELYGKRAIGKTLSAAWASRALEDSAHGLERELHGFRAREALKERVWTLECRQVGQTHTIELAYLPGADSEDALQDRFRREHERLYGIPGHKEIEIITLRLTLASERPEFNAWWPRNGREAAIDLPESHSVAIEGEAVPVHDRRDLGEGAAGDGPCLVSDQSTTVYVPSDARWQVDAFGSLLVEL